MAKMNKVCVNLDQSNASSGGFTDAEKAQARQNIGAGTGDGNSTIKFSNVIGGPDNSDANVDITKERHNLPATGEHYNMKVTNAQGNIQTFALAPTNLNAGLMVMSNAYISTISIDSLKDFAFAEYGTTTFSEIQNMLNAGKQVLLTSGGKLTGFYKYSTDDSHLFQYFYSDPVRFMEYWCTAPNTWSNYTYYATDLRSLPQYCYYREEIGNNGYQASVSNPKWSICPPSATWYDMAGTAKTGSTQNDLLKSYGFPRTCRYGASATVQLQTDAVLDPSVSIVCRLKLIYSYRTEGSTSYVEFDVPFWEGQLYTFTNFRDISYGTTVRSVSDPIQLNAIADLPQNYWKALANSSTIYDYHFRYVLEAIHGIPSSVSTMWLERSGMRESLAIMY